MDRLYKIRREDTLPFNDGHCHVCSQSNVKVKPLYCGKHNYCRMCKEFVPRLVKGDLNCTKCSESLHRRETDSLHTVEKFLADQTRTTFGNDSGLANVDQLEDIEADDDSDLEGGNTEWDHLLQSICEEEEEETKSSVATNLSRGGMYTPLRTPAEETDFEELTPIPHKPSFIRLVLPSANTSYVVDENQPSTSKQPISNTVTELLYPPEHIALPSYIPSKANHRGSSSESDSSSRSSGSSHELFLEKKERNFSTDPRKTSSSSDSFVTDPEEKERGTSPDKGRRLRQPFGWCAGEIWDKKQDSNSELVVREIGQIEGPVSDNSDSDVLVEVAAANKDSFWDI